MFLLVKMEGSRLGALFAYRILNGKAWRPPKAAWIDATTPARARPAPAAHAGELLSGTKQRSCEGPARSARRRRALRLPVGAGRERQDPPSARFFRGGGGCETRSRCGGRR